MTNPPIPAAIAFDAEQEADRALTLLRIDATTDNTRSCSELNRSVAKLNDAKAFLRYAIGLAGLWLALVASVALVVWAVR